MHDLLGKECLIAIILMFAWKLLLKQNENKWKLQMKGKNVFCNKE